MNKLPDNFERDLELERTLESGDRPPHDEALAADWRLRRELRRLGGARLPVEVRDRVLRGRRRPGAPRWLGAIAAVLLLAVVLAVLRGAPETPSARPVDGRELAQLGLALDAIRDAGERAARLTHRELSQGLALPQMDLAGLPYAGLVARSLRPATAPAGIGGGTERPSNPTDKEENPS